MTLCALAVGCKQENPLLKPFDTPFGTPPFDKIRPEHYIPAFEAGIAQLKAEAEAIAVNPEAPTFENTIVALERSGSLLTRVGGVFFNLTEADSSPEMDSIELIVQPMLTQAHNDVKLDPRIFERVKAVYDMREGLNLDLQDARLLEKSYKGFTRSGAALSDADKEKYRAITGELSELTSKFGQNVLAATNAFSMTLNEEQVAELPGFVKEGMAHEAAAKGQEGYLLTLQAPSMSPYMTYSTDRAVKETVWRTYSSRCFGGENDNSNVVKRIAELRLQMANLLGYATYADYALEERMAATSANVNAFLAELLAATRPYADKDFEMVKAYAASEGQAEFKPWDFGYYDEKLKTQKYEFNEEEIKPYFQLENVQRGIFLLAEKLYGLEFRENKDIPVFHPDVTTYEVYDAEGRFMAILYLDFFPRESKRGGAWMTSFRELSIGADGKESRPLVSLTCNFTKPTATTPSLLTFREFETFLHEFGHCLHGILAEGRYESQTGTSVYRDFVELPSQIMENWATEKEFLDLWAVHYQTGERMPSELIDKVIASKNYLAAWLAVRQLFFGIDDMAWHSITAPVTEPVDVFEQRAVAPAQIFPVEKGTCVCTSFGHIFSGGYAAGYYSYKWAEVLEADAFSLFKQKGIFNKEVADSFRDNILSKGGSENPMDLYVRFRGHKPDNAALLRKIGVMGDK